MKSNLEIHIVGPMGSGKTNLRQFIEHALRAGIADDKQKRHLRFHGQEIGLYEHTTAPSHPNCRCVIQHREDGLQDDGKPLEVMPNPTDRKGALPWVRFAPGNGWSIYDTKHKGCHCPKLADAVADWNRYIDRTLAGLNIELVKASRHRVLDLPGWGDAVKQERVDRIARKAIAEGEEAARTVNKAARMGSPLEGFIGKPDAFTSEGPFDFKTSPKPKRSVIPALLSLAAAFGGLSEIMGAIDEPEGGPIDVFNPEMVRILKEAGLLHPSLDGPDSAIVAIPRMIGAENIERLENAIREGDVDAVKFLIVELNL